MKRIAVLGAPGAGKTEFSLQLAQATGLPVFHLDGLFFEKEYDSHGRAWFHTVEKVVARDKWIIDGNYSSTFKIRFDRADTIIVLDYPKRIFIGGVIKRRLKHHSKHRPEMPAGWKERLNKDFVNFVWTFDKRYKSRIYDAFEDDHKRKLVILHSRKDARNYLESFYSKVE
jgi:adenylate kinase family enzyme